jgi:hypothetical protein
MSKAILSIAYLPPIQYFCKLLAYDEIIIEAEEHYNKQSYRNRCNILGPNGIQTLSIPVERGRSREIPIRDIGIDNSMNWQENHKRSIMTAYRSAPYFDFYFDELLPMYETKANNLFEFNLSLIKTICDLLNIETKITLSDSYIAEPDCDDFRESIHPKQRMQKADKTFVEETYMQVFMEKFDFVPNLSILDLLMNEGPLSSSHLKKCNRY